MTPKTAMSVRTCRQTGLINSSGAVFYIKKAADEKKNLAEKVERLVLKTMAKESTKAQISGGRMHVLNALRTTRSTMGNL
jgi:hypothetical protein